MPVKPSMVASVMLLDEFSKSIVEKLGETDLIMLYAKFNKQNQATHMGGKKKTKLAYSLALFHPKTCVLKQQLGPHAFPFIRLFWYHFGLLFDCNPLAPHLQSLITLIAPAHAIDYIGKEHCLLFCCCVLI